MSIKLICAIAAVIALVVAAWWFRDSPIVHDTAGDVAGFAKSIVPDNSYTVGKTGAGNSAGNADRAISSHPPRKCVSATRTIYTDEACPSGSREEPIGNDNNAPVIMRSQRAGGLPTGGEKAK